eukprot:scaffold14009_cov110-Isochrysis_galbana.AAC.2
MNRAQGLLAKLRHAWRAAGSTVRGRRPFAASRGLPARSVRQLPPEVATWISLLQLGARCRECSGGMTQLRPLGRERLRVTRPQLGVHHPRRPHCLHRLALQHRGVDLVARGRAVKAVGAERERDAVRHFGLAALEKGDEELVEGGEGRPRKQPLEVLAPAVQADASLHLLPQ